MSNDRADEATVRCPACKGKKHVFAHVNYGGAKPNEWKHIDCATCRGLGFISESQLRLIEDGKKKRAERMARGVSLREEADRLGIKVTRLSDIEHGRVSPSQSSPKVLA